MKRNNGSGGDATYEDLIQRGMELADAQQHVLAAPLLKRAVEMKPNDAQALDALGEILVEMGEYDEARSCFQRSVKIAPNECGTKWMSLGQLLQGHKALQSYERGIMLLQQQLQSGTEDLATQQMYRRQLVAAQVSVAELFMSDLCMEADAEARCEAALQIATEMDPTGVEPLQSMASMRISQHRGEEAADIMKRVVAMIASNIVVEDAGGVQYAHQEIPYDFRVQSARLLVELGLFGEALNLLERLVEEDDEMAEVWMLLGMCHRSFMGVGSTGGDDADDAREAAIECFERAEELLKEFVKQDPRSPLFRTQLAQVQELLKTV